MDFKFQLKLVVGCFFHSHWIHLDVAVKISTSKHVHFKICFQSFLRYLDPADKISFWEM